MLPTTPRGRSVGDGSAAWRAVAAALVVAGCSAEAVSPDDVGQPDDSSTADGNDASDDGGREDGGTADDGGDVVCVPAPEVCNGLDDDCDGDTDDGFDFLTDMDNCGECGVSCSLLPHADAVCTEGACVIGACMAGWVDANGGPGDGCEYECAPSAASESPDDGTCTDGFDNDCDARIDVEDTDCSDCVPEFCDAIDNDCDGLTDEDFDVDFDPLNCGRCRSFCPVRPNALPNCVLGECDFTCQPGFEDRDGFAYNGCEAACTPAGDPSEVECDGRDDDCDGLTDEGFAPTTCGSGLCERNSVCHRGVVRCEPRTPPASVDATCDGLDDDCDGATDEEWAATGCVGQCAATAACVAGVGACGVPAATDNTCDGLDDDCDGATDEEYATYTCGMGVCQRTSVCFAGLERCVPGTAGTESCNGRDDDCDGTTDDDPPAPAVLCAPADHGSTGCVSGSCTMTGCDAGWVDGDGSAANGCECQLEATEGSGETCAGAYDLDSLAGGSFVDNSGADVRIRGKIAPDGDEDWYRFTAVDSPDASCDSYNVDVRFTANPGSVFRMDVYRGDCGSTTCTSIADGYAWYTDFSSGSGTTAVGECQCRTSATEGYTLCADESSVYMFRVFRAAGAVASCAEYEIRVSNGVY